MDKKNYRNITGKTGKTQRTQKDTKTAKKHKPQKKRLVFYGYGKSHVVFYGMYDFAWSYLV